MDSLTEGIKTLAVKGNDPQGYNETTGQETPVFPQFVALPSELRLLVWNEALRARSRRPPIIRQLFYFPHMAKEKPPALLQVNHEARYEAQKHYTQRAITFIDRPPMILFFSPGVETVFLDTRTISGPSPEFKGLPRRCFCTQRTQWLDSCWCSTAYHCDRLIEGCPCPHASLENRQRHLLDRLSYADTSSIPHVALHMHGDEDSNWVGLVGIYTRAAFHAARSITFVVNMKKQRARITGFPASNVFWHEDFPTWYAYRNHFDDHNWNDAKFKLWVRDDVWGCWWKLEDGPVEDVPWLLAPFVGHDREKKRMTRGTLLEDLLDGGLE